MEAGSKNVHIEMEEEDLLFRGALKQACYEYESHGDPRILQAHIAELMEGSKARQRELFAKYNGTPVPRKETF